jgi:Ca2+-binding EF-hand superfamily protein
MGAEQSALGNEQLRVADVPAASAAFHEKAVPRSRAKQQRAVQNDPKTETGRQEGKSELPAGSVGGNEQQGKGNSNPVRRLLRKFSSKDKLRASTSKAEKKTTADDNDDGASTGEKKETSIGRSRGHDDELVLDQDGVAELLRLPVGGSAVQRLVSMFDSDGDGFTNYAEFLVLLAFFSRGDDKLEIATREKIDVLFRAFDTDNSGSLERSEVAELFAAMACASSGLVGVSWSDDERRKQIDSAFATAAAASDSITQDEFADWAQSDGSMQQFLRRLADLSQGIAPQELTPFKRDAGDTRVRVLCLDGGGMKGAIQATVIARIEREYPGFISSVDCFAGTSVGALLAASYATGYHPDKVLADFLKESPDMFEGHAGTVLADAKRLVTSANSNEMFRQGVKEAFGDSRLSDLKRQLLVPAFRLKHTDEGTGMDTWKPKFFHNFPDDQSGDSGDSDELVRDVVLRSMAAPTYFPSYQNFIDGGVCANSPSMCAVAQLVAPRYGQKAISDIVLLSFGTGTFLCGF